MPAPPPKSPEGELDPEKVAILIATLDKLRRKQRLMIAGYLGALILLIVGLAVAFYLYGTLEEGPYRAFVFFIPLALTGIMLWVFGRMSRKADLDLRSEKRRDTYKKP